MSANLTLNYPKTKFLIIGVNFLRQTTHETVPLILHAIFGFIIDERLSFFDQVSSLSVSWYSRVCELRCIYRYLDSKRVLSLPVLSTLNLATVIL